MYFIYFRLFQNYKIDTRPFPAAYISELTGWKTLEIAMFFPEVTGTK